MEILLYLQKRAPVRFTLTACTIDEGFGGFETERIAEHCSRKKVPFILKRERILQIIQEKNLSGSHFCFLCARLRRGTLYTLARQQGFNKIALAHQSDDFIETLLQTIPNETVAEGAGPDHPAIKGNLLRAVLKGQKIKVAG